MHDFKNRLSKMSSERRDYTLQALIRHLDRQGNDPRAVSRMLSLFNLDFVKVKIALTHDVPAANQDYNRFFRACLRSSDVSSALQLAKSRAGISLLNQWLIADHIGPLLSHMDTESFLWQQTRNTLLAVPSPADRVEKLTSLCRPSLPVAIYAWLREQFELDATETDVSRQRAFLLACVSNQEGIIDFVLRHLNRIGADSDLLTTIFEHLDGLVRGSDISIAQLIADLTQLATRTVDTFVAACDALAKYPNRDIAVKVLIAMVDALTELPEYPDPISCPAALSHSFFVCCEKERAQLLALRCLAATQSAFTDSEYDNFYRDRMVNAAVRLVLAAAPFHDMWSAAVDKANIVATQAFDKAQTQEVRSLSHARRAKVLSGYLKATLWIAEPRQRIKWLNRQVLDIKAFIEEEHGTNDIEQQWWKTFAGKNVEEIAIEPIENALFEVLAQIDRVLPDREDTQLFETLLFTAAQVKRRVGGGPKTLLPFFKQILPSLTASSNERVVANALFLFISIVAQQNLISNKAAEVFAEALKTLTEKPDSGFVGAMTELALDKVQKEWCSQHTSMYGVLMIVLLRATTESGRTDLFHAFQDRLLFWLRQTDPNHHDMLTLQWAASLISLGRQDEGERMLRYIWRKQQYDSSSPSTRRKIAHVLVDAGIKDRAAELLHEVFVDRVDLNDAEATQYALGIARDLLHVGDSPSARDLFLKTARQYREHPQTMHEDIEATILGGFNNAGDRSLILRLLELAEVELLQDVRGDAGMAACWYVMLALSVTGEVEAAQKVWRQLDDWKKLNWLANVRETLLRLIYEVSAEQGDFPVLFKKLVNQLDVIEEAEPYGHSLEMTAQSIPNCSPTITSNMVELAVLAMRRLHGQPRHFENVLDVLCQHLTPLTDSALVFNTLQNIFELLASGNDIKKAGLPMGDLSGVINSSDDPIELMAYMSRTPANLLPLIKSQSDPDRIRLLLERYMRCGIKKGHHSDKAESIAQAIDHAVTCLTSATVMEILLIGFELSDQIDYSETRRDLLLRVVSSVVRSNVFSGRFTPFKTLMGQIEDRLKGPNAKALLWASFYRDLCDHDQDEALKAWAAHRVKTLPAPDNTVASVAWLSYLFSTPLQMLAKPVADAFFDDLDRFTAGYDELRALQKYLMSVSKTWLATELESHFIRLANWAATMPKVKNEEARHDAFNSIMAAVEQLNPAQQPPIRRLVLIRATGVLGDYAYQTVRSGSERDEELADEKLADLQGSDLMQLNQKPVAWWIELAPDFEFSDITRDALKQWVEAFAHDYPHAAVLGVILSSAWISQHQPEQLPAFWYDLATAKVLSRDDQLVLAGMIVNDLNHLRES